MCRAVLPPDRWAGYQPETADSSGRVITGPLRIDGCELYLTAEVANGLIRVSVLGNGGELLAESQPISGDVTDSKVIWRQHESLTHQIGRDLRLRFDIKNATLYAFRFGGKPVTD